MSFKVGDRVRIVGCGDDWDGITGTVFEVRENGMTRFNELRLSDNPSEQQLEHILTYPDMMQFYAPELELVEPFEGFKFQVDDVIHNAEIDVTATISDRRADLEGTGDAYQIAFGRKDEGIHAWYDREYIEENWSHELESAELPKWEQDLIAQINDEPDLLPDDVQFSIEDEISYPRLVLEALEYYRANLLVLAYEGQDELLVKVDQLGDSISDLEALLS